MQAGDAFVIGIAILAMLTFNFIPTFVAYGRNHPERQLIGRLNVLSLISFALWLALIAWAIGGARDDSTINRFVKSSENRGRLIAIVVVLVTIGVASTAYALIRGQ